MSYFGSKSDKQKNRINNSITASKVRLVGEDGELVGIVGIEEALSIAKKSNKDLVEIAPDSDPPVCKVLDYDRFVYELKKKVRANKKKQSITKIKEIKLRPKIEKHDYEVKLKAMRGFLEEANKVKVSMRFFGREIRFKDEGIEIMNRVIENLSDIAKVESELKYEGSIAQMILTPQKKG